MASVAVEGLLALNRGHREDERALTRRAELATWFKVQMDVRFFVDIKGRERHHPAEFGVQPQREPLDYIVHQSQQ